MSGEALTLHPEIDPKKLIVQEGVDEGRIDDTRLAWAGAFTQDRVMSDLADAGLSDEQIKRQSEMQAETNMANLVGERARRLSAEADMSDETRDRLVAKLAERAFRSELSAHKKEEVEVLDGLEQTPATETDQLPFARQADLDRILSRLPEDCSDQERAGIDKAIWNVEHSQSEQQIELAFGALRMLVQFANDRRKDGTSLDRRRADRLGTPLSPTTPEEWAKKQEQQRHIDMDKKHDGRERVDVTEEREERTAQPPSESKAQRRPRVAQVVDPRSGRIVPYGQMRRGNHPQGGRIVGYE